MTEWTLCRASRLEALVDALAARPRTAYAIEPVRILAASPSQIRWLRLELADRLEVCAHVELLLPSGLVAELEQRAGIASATDRWLHHRWA